MVNMQEGGVCKDIFSGTRSVIGTWKKSCGGRNDSRKIVKQFTFLTYKYLPLNSFMK